MGREVYEDPAWRAAANRLNAGLLLLDVGTTDAPTAEPLPPEKQVIRNAALGGGDALIALLDRFSQNPGYAELKKAPLLIWGFSASGSFAATFATAHPERTVGFVRFHSHSRGLALDLATLTKTPALLIAGGSDSTAGVDDAQQLWRTGRAAGAPWTFAIHPEQQHGRGVRESQDFQLAWISAVIQQRLAEDEDGSLRQVPTQRPETAWFPEERSARLWQALTGKRRE